MTVSEIKAVWEIQKKSNRNIYLSYTKPSGKTGVAYIPVHLNEQVFIELYILKYGKEVNYRNMQRAWTYEQMLEWEKKDKDIYIALKKAQGGEVIAPIDGITFQNEKKAERIRILYGQ